MPPSTSLDLSFPELRDVERFRALGPQHLTEIGERFGLGTDIVDDMRLHATVLPFRVNEYVLENLIDWDDIPNDPIYQLVFPQPGMLPGLTKEDLGLLRDAPNKSPEHRALVARLRADLNPHPSGQQEHNVPRWDDERVEGVQHKYEQTALYFPSQGQTCHAYCTYCFRWAQFIGDADLRFSSSSPDQFVGYLGQHPEIHDVLVTGGDSMIMSTARLRQHLEPILTVPTVRTIRFGTKALAYWPARFTTDADADDLLRLIEEIVASGRTVAVMAHMSHPRELQTDLARWAMERLRDSRALIYCQAPLMAHINDDADTWADLWKAEVATGGVPYYMFMARDTGPQQYFEVAMPRAWQIFTDAYRQLPGLSRTVRGPVMSAAPGKVLVDGIEGSPGNYTATLRFEQARDANLVGRPFRAHCPDDAGWLDDVTLMPDTPSDIRAAIETYRD